MTTTKTGRQITPEDVRAIADAAIANQRSVERRMLGLPVRGRVGARIDAELERRGFATTTPKA